MSAKDEATLSLGDVIAGVLLVTVILAIVGAAVALLYSKWSEVSGKFSRAEETIYENFEGDCNGSDVLNAISNFKDDDICIEVKTKNGTVTAYIYTDETLQTESTAKLSEAKTKKSASYINPGAPFIGEIIRDDNDVITKLYFEQQ